MNIRTGADFCRENWGVAMTTCLFKGYLLGISNLNVVSNCGAGGKFMSLRARLIRGPSCLNTTWNDDDSSVFLMYVVAT